MVREIKMELIADRLKKARIKKGYQSCRHFALKHDFCERTYQRHEGAVNNMDFSIIMRYCQALDISILWLQTGKEMFLDIPFSTYEFVLDK
jgi:hypothetical protein